MIVWFRVCSGPSDSDQYIFSPLLQVLTEHFCRPLMPYITRLTQHICWLCLLPLYRAVLNTGSFTAFQDLTYPAWRQWWMVLMRSWGWMSQKWETLSWDAHDLTLSPKWLNPDCTAWVVSLRHETGWKENSYSLKKHTRLSQSRSTWPKVEQEGRIVSPDSMQSQAFWDLAFSWNSQVVAIVWCASSAAAVDLTRSLHPLHLMLSDKKGRWCQQQLWHIDKNITTLTSITTAMHQWVNDASVWVTGMPSLTSTCLFLSQSDLTGMLGVSSASHHNEDCITAAVVWQSPLLNLSESQPCLLSRTTPSTIQSPTHVAGPPLHCARYWKNYCLITAPNLLLRMEAQSTTFDWWA